MPSDFANLLLADMLAAFIALHPAPAYLAEHGTPFTPEDLAQHKALYLLSRNGETRAFTLNHGKETREVLPVRAAA